MTARQKAFVTLGLLLMIAGCGYLVAVRALDRSVKEGHFRSLVSRKSAIKLSASECGYLPITRHGLSLHSDGILARGRPPHHLVELNAVNLRARCSVRNLWRRKLTIPRLEASQLQAAYGEAAAAKLKQILPGQPTLEAAEDTESSIHIDIRETDIAHTDVLWGSSARDLGEVKNANARFITKDNNLDVFGRGGTFQQTGWPLFNVDELHFNWSESKLVVQSASLSLGSPKNFNVTGEFDFAEQGSMRLHISAKQSPAEPFVLGYWKGRFDGVIDSETDLKKEFRPDSKVSAEGDLIFSSARLHDVDLLKKIAVITHQPGFEKPKIDALRFHYRWTGNRLEISNLAGEIRGLCRVEGNFSIKSGNIDGNFKVGTTAEVLETVPGAREEVFTESGDGYFWTGLRLNGPANHPSEDLKPRLVAAAQKHFAAGLLAPIVKPAKALIEMLSDIY